MMKRREIELFLDRVSVHGMQFAIISPIAPYGLRFEIIHRTIDSETLKPVTIAQSSIMPEEFYDERELARWLYTVVQERYLHEAAEFFKIDGRAPFHPHVDNAHQEALRR